MGLILASYMEFVGPASVICNVVLLVLLLIFLPMGIRAFSAIIDIRDMLRRMAERQDHPE